MLNRRNHRLLCSLDVIDILVPRNYDIWISGFIHNFNDIRIRLNINDYPAYTIKITRVLIKMDNADIEIKEQTEYSSTILNDRNQNTKTYISIFTFEGQTLSTGRN